MASAHLKFGIPDIELASGGGQAINPSDFAGHDLIALFCPLDPSAAAREIAAYRNRRDELVGRDAWLLTFVEHWADGPQDNRDRLSLIADPDRRAWVAFRDLTGHPEEFDRDSGATFLFTRGGGLHRYWHGAGCIDDVLRELCTPSSGHNHQLAG